MVTRYSAPVAGQGTPATALLGRQKVTHRVHAYDHDPRAESYGTEAAAALQVAPERCFKTLVAEVAYSPQQSTCVKPARRYRASASGD